MGKGDTAGTTSFIKFSIGYLLIKYLITFGACNTKLQPDSRGYVEKLRGTLVQLCLRSS